MSLDVGWLVRDKPTCDKCTVQCCFSSTETVRLIRTESPGWPPWLSHSSWTLTIFRSHGSDSYFTDCFKIQWFSVGMWQLYAIASKNALVDDPHCTSVLAAWHAIPCLHPGLFSTFLLVWLGNWTECLVLWMKMQSTLKLCAFDCSCKISLTAFLG